MRPLVAVSFAVLIVACKNPPVTSPPGVVSPGSDPGRGDSCTSVSRGAWDTAHATETFTAPLCTSTSDPTNPARVPVDDTCLCDTPAALGSTLVDVCAQQSSLFARNNGVGEFRQSCQKSCQPGKACSIFEVDGVGCYQLGFMDGYLMDDTRTDAPGSGSNDADNYVNTCPLSTNGVMSQGGFNGRTTWVPLELRSTRKSAHGLSLHNELVWCRYYGGQVSFAGGPGYSDFGPDFLRGDRGEWVSIVGDWIACNRSRSLTACGSRSAS